MKYKLTIESDNAEELIALIGGKSRAKVEHSGPTPEPVTMPDTAPMPQPEPTPAPSAPPQPAAAPPAPCDDTRDSAGLPWDERIHASSKAVNADGTWRKRRGVDDAVFAAVEAELKGGPTPETAPDAASESTPTPTPTPSAPPMPQGDNAPAPVQSEAPAPAAQPEPTPAPAPMPEPAADAAPGTLPEPVAGTLPEDFTSFMKMVQAGMRRTGPDGTPLINPQYLQELVGKINDAYASHEIKIASITDLVQHPFMIGWVSQVMQNDGKAVLD